MQLARQKKTTFCYLGASNLHLKHDVFVVFFVEGGWGGTVK